MLTSPYHLMSASAITSVTIGPWAAGNLMRAAAWSRRRLELFDERGYARTTVEDIAARAGLTERTFFRYFTDKREVLFSGSGALEALIVETIGAAPASVPPLTAVTRAIEALAPWFESRRGLRAKAADGHRRVRGVGRARTDQAVDARCGYRRHSAQARSCRADRRARCRDGHRDLQECIRALG